MEYPQAMDPRWAWHYRTLTALRDSLLQAQRQRLHEATGSIEEPRADPGERSNEESSQEIALVELRAETAELSAVEAALARLRNGTYGICAVTGQPISADRLRAVPWTTRSREAAVEREQTNRNGAKNPGARRP